VKLRAFCRPRAIGGESGSPGDLGHGDLTNRIGSGHSPLRSHPGYPPGRGCMLVVRRLLENYAASVGRYALVTMCIGGRTGDRGNLEGHVSRFGFSLVWSPPDHRESLRKRSGECRLVGCGFVEGAESPAKLVQTNAKPPNAGEGGCVRSSSCGLDDHALQGGMIRN